MTLRDWLVRSDDQPGAPGAARTRRLSRGMAPGGSRPSRQPAARLVTLWASRDEHAAATIHAAFLADRRGLVLNLAIADPQAPYPGLEDLFPAAARMQRAIADLSGLRSTDSDARAWLRHAAWPQNYRPLIDPQRAAAD